MFRLGIVLSVLFFTVNADAAILQCQDHQCIAVVDAGSTGSRLHIYAYDLQDNNPAHINELFSKKIQPGIATIERNSVSVHQYLTQLFAETPEKNMPVYFYATAGMRLLSHESQHAYYVAIKEWFATQPEWRLMSAKTITGQEEGVYGWLAVNYGLGTLASPDKPLVGVMDMGGASTQITFPIQSTDEHSNVEIDVYGRHIQLFVHSFLGLGQNELDHQYLDVANCFSENYQLPNGKLAHGDFASCVQETSLLINAVHHVDKTIQPVMRANPVKTWYALGAISYLVQTPPLMLDNGQFTIKEIADWTDREFCHQDWPTLVAQHPKNEYLYTSCLNSSYFYALLVDGYGMEQEQGIHYIPKDQNGDDWTLGVVLRHF